MIASVTGTLSGGRLIRTRPYRAPHHSASMVSLVGGGLRVRPGEVSLAHLGILFHDELPDLAASEEVRRVHVAEALSYRRQGPRS